MESLFNYTQQPACKRPKHKIVSPKQLAKSLRRCWGLSASICKVLEGQYCPNWFTTAIHFTALTHNLSLNNCYLKKDTYDFFVALYWELTKLLYNRYFLLLIEPQCHFVEQFIWHQIFCALSCTCRSMSVFKELRQVICNPFQSSPSFTILNIFTFTFVSLVLIPGKLLFHCFQFFCVEEKYHSSHGNWKFGDDKFLKIVKSQ